MPWFRFILRPAPDLEHIELFRDVVRILVDPVRHHKEAALLLDLEEPERRRIYYLQIRDPELFLTVLEEHRATPCAAPEGRPLETILCKGFHQYRLRRTGS